MAVENSLLYHIVRGEGRVIAEEYDGMHYHRFRQEYRNIERGTVLIGKRVIWGFPHIKRIFTLEKGLEKNMKIDSFVIEEKIDGFNVRVAAINEKIYAFSRGGFIEPFTTEKVRKIGLEKFFHDYPEYVLCGEMIGNTPFTKPTKEYDVKLLIFDIDRGDGEYLAPAKKYALLNKYGIESVPAFGTFTKQDVEKIKKIALTLNKEKKEGMVIKSSDRKEVVKYVTPFADIEDIGNNAHLLFDMPTGFYVQRVLRSAIFIKDYNLEREEYAKRLGNAIYAGLIKNIERLERGEGAGEEFEIVVENEKTWENIEKRMRKEVNIEILWRKKEEEGTRIRFRKIYRKSTKRIREFLHGKGIVD